MIKETLITWFLFTVIVLFIGFINTLNFAWIAFIIPQMLALHHLLFEDK